MQAPFSTPTRNPSNNFAPKPERFRCMSWQWPLILCVWNTVTEYSHVGQTHPVSPYHGGVCCTSLWPYLPDMKIRNLCMTLACQREAVSEGSLAYMVVGTYCSNWVTLQCPNSSNTNDIMWTHYSLHTNLWYQRITNFVCWYNPAVCHEHQPCGACSGSPHDDESSD